MTAGKVYLEQRIDAVESVQDVLGADLADLKARVAVLEKPPTPTPTPTPPPTPMPEPPGWRLVWSDNFDGAAVDARKWVTGSNSWGGVTYSHVAWKSENCVISDGVLRMIVRRESLNGKEFTGSILHTNGKFIVPATGRFEVRARYSSQPGLWPALWLLHDEPNRGAGIVEVDLLECMTHKPDEPYHNFHWYDAPGDAGHRQYNKWMRRAAGYGQEWHTYAVEWIAGHGDFVYSIDGQETWRHNKPIPVGPMHVLMTSKVGGWGGNWPLPDFQESALEIDYVRVYERVAGGGAA